LPSGLSGSYTSSALTLELSDSVVALWALSPSPSTFYFLAFGLFRKFHLPFKPEQADLVLVPLVPHHRRRLLSLLDLRKYYLLSKQANLTTVPYLIDDNQAFGLFGKLHLLLYKPEQADSVIVL
jgi:hypothetical protein